MNRLGMHLILTMPTTISATLARMKTAFSWMRSFARQSPKFRLSFSIKIKRTLGTINLRNPIWSSASKRASVS